MKINSELLDNFLLIVSVARLNNEKDLCTHASLVYEKIKQHSTQQILVDATHTEFPFDLYYYYDLVQYYSDNFPEEVKEIKVACVIAPQFGGAASFWQTLATNRGYHCKSFTCINEAKNWLTGDQSAKRRA